MTKFALYVPLQAKPGKEKDVADFLRSALPLVNAEAGTVSWFAIQEGPSSVAIFDTFDDEAARNAHLNGKVAAALMEKAKAGALFGKTPERCVGLERSRDAIQDLPRTRPDCVSSEHNVTALKDEKSCGCPPQRR